MTHSLVGVTAMGFDRTTFDGGQEEVRLDHIIGSARTITHCNRCEEKSKECCKHVITFEFGGLCGIRTHDAGV